MAYRDSRFRRAVDDDDEDEYGYDDQPRTASSLAALLPKPDPQMDERWRAAENQALDHATPEQYGAAEGVRDFAPMAVGSVLDILINKGKGLGALAAGGMQALSSESSRRDTARAQSAKEALAIKQQRDAGGDRMTNAYHALLRGEELENRINEDRAQRGTPEEQSELRRMTREKLGAETRNTTAEAVEREKYPGAGTMLKYLQMGSTEQRAAALLALKERELTSKEEENKLKREGLERDRTDKAETKAKDTSVKNRQDYNRRTEKLQSEARSVREINGILRRYPGDVPGSGPADSRMPNWWTSDDGLRVKGLRAGLLTSEILEATGKASRDKEELRIMAIHGLGPNATDREFRLGMEAFTKLTRERLSGWRSGMEGDADAVLGEAGLYDFVFPDGPPGGAPGAAQPPPSAAPPPDDAMPARPEQQPLGSAAGAQPDPATERAAPTPKQIKELKALAAQIPAGERDAVLSAIDPSLPFDEQLRILSEEMARRVVRRGPDPADSLGTPSGSPKPKAIDRAKSRGWVK